MADPANSMPRIVEKSTNLDLTLFKNVFSRSQNSAIPSKKGCSLTMPQQPQSIEEFFSYRLNIVSRLINRRSTQHFKDRYNLKLAEWRALTHIAAGKHRTAKAIAESTYDDKAHTSRAIAGLLKKGLVKSQPNPRDKRSIELFLTKKGADIHADILKRRVDENRFIGSILSSSELKSLNEMLDRLQTHLTSMQ